MIRIKKSAICKHCGANGEHSICIAKPPYPVLPMSALESLYAGNRPPVTETLRNAVTKIEAASRKVGRPKKRNALSAAERARAYRERKKNA
jgi:hypothetical protein